MAVLARALAPYRALDRRIWLIGLTRCINTMGFSIVMPFMSMYLVRSRGVLASTVGVIYLAAGICGATMQGVSGELADRIGRRRIMTLALSLRAGNMLLLGLAVNARAHLPVLAALIVLNSMLRNMFEPAAGAAVTDFAPETQRVTAFGLQRVFINLAWAIGPALGGATAAIGYGHLFYFAAPTLLAAAAVASRIPDARRPRLPTAPETPRLVTLASMVRENRPFFICLCLVLYGATLTVQLHSTLSTYMGAELGYSPGAIGLIYTINGVLVVLLQVPAVHLIQRGGARVALVMGPTLYTISYFLLGLSDRYAWIAGCMALLTFGEVVFSPALSDMAVFLGDPRRHGRSFGLFGLAQTLGISLGPLVGGAIFDHLRHDHVHLWTTIAALMSLSALAYFLFTRRYAPRVQ